MAVVEWFHPGGHSGFLTSGYSMFYELKWYWSYEVNRTIAWDRCKTRQLSHAYKVRDGDTEAGRSLRLRPAWVKQRPSISEGWGLGTWISRQEHLFRAWWPGLPAREGRTGSSQLCSDICASMYKHIQSVNQCKKKKVKDRCSSCLLSLLLSLLFSEF